jgi:cellulose synthase/poly-beta-1,6-N-acetylglucosamine synthase-like glycosyltransferase
MALAILVSKTYLIFIIFLLLIYTIRHFIFTFNRVFGEQRISYQDILDSELPSVSILIPMHNEEKVARNILSLLVVSDYPRDKFEIIPINDHSTDKTKDILDEYAKEYNFIKPIHRDNHSRGKTHALNDALKISNGSVILVYDADYIPPKGQVRDLVMSFNDPEIGAVMGRVIPINTGTNLLTKLLDIERSGGYQVDQQARYNMGLIPQYGGTVGGFRKNLIIELGGFDSKILAEDTEFTFRLYLNGYKVVYANRAECYEEAPEDWNVRAGQIRRWSRGHNQVMFKYFIPLLLSRKLRIKEKFDGLLLLCIYIIPFLTLLGWVDSIFLFFMGEMEIFGNGLFFLAVAAYNSFGNFAPFYQLGLAAFLDGITDRIRLLPFFYFVFVFNIFYTSFGFIDAVIDMITQRKSIWHKTERFRK